MTHPFDESVPISQYGADRRAAEANDERLHAMTTRKRVASRAGASKSEAVKRGVPICMSCHEKYDVKWEGTMPKFYDHGTLDPHRCKS